MDNSVHFSERKIERQATIFAQSPRAASRCVLPIGVKETCGQLVLKFSAGKSALRKI